MIKKAYHSSVLFLSLLFLEGCIDPYSISVSDGTMNLLVIDGFLNTSTQSVSVKLSRAQGIAVKESYPPVTQASVILEDEDGHTTELTEKEKGDYDVSLTSLTVSKKYRLRIQLPDGEKYLSEYIRPLISPPLDSVSWKPHEEGITIYANAYDATNQTRYYKWQYTETWSYYARFYSFFKLVDGEAIYRTQEENIYYCWGTEKSSTILVTSTTRLGQDRVNEFPLTFVAKGSRKVSKIYSILVEQRAIDEKAYDYWTQLQKTTENLGGLFDPMPSQVKGNFYNENNTSEPVLGYFSGGSVEQNRIYINFNDLPTHLLVNEYGKQCEITEVLVEDLHKLPYDKVLLESFGQFVILGYTVSTTECADCTSFGGTTTKPDFWP